MKFLYKVHSAFDGFTPSRIRERMRQKHLKLGWKRYLDVVDDGDEVWVFFRGPHKFEPGVYVKGRVLSHDHGREEVLLRVTKWSPTKPLTDPVTSKRIAETVAPRGRQVFVYPTDWDNPPDCDVDSTARTCRAHHCDTCPVWNEFPLIQKSALGWPSRLDNDAVKTFAPAFWAIPPRCYLHQEGSISHEIKHSTELFMRFKVGEENLAYPLALGMFRALQARHQLEWDVLVPVPLSPDKIRKQELHRTRWLARELGEMLGARISEHLSLQYPISKRRLLKKGVGPAKYEKRYAKALVAGRRLSNVSRVLIVDDVCTHGSTLSCVARELQRLYPDAHIGATTAAQMILRGAIENSDSLLA